MQKSDHFTQSVYNMVDSLNLARSYAMAKNTYVYVALEEVDRSQNQQASPQNPGTGRVALSIVATTDGTSDVSSWSNTGANVRQVQPVQAFDAFHVTAYPTASFLTSSGNMERPQNISANPTLIQTASGTPALGYSLPLGTTTGSGKYNFNNTYSQVICFNPQGELLQPKTSGSNVSLSPVQWAEIDLQPVVGTVTPSAPTNSNKGNQAALVIDGVSGAVTVYRP